MADPVAAVCANAVEGTGRRGALTNSSRHWTEQLRGSEHATTPLGARFHLRKLFLRASVDEFSQSELEFITEYLVNETTIAEQPWWAALTRYEQLEIVNMLELHHISRDDHESLWFSSKETSKECILIYGTAEAKPMDGNQAPVLKFTEGCVVGNITLPTSAQNSPILAATDDEGVAGGMLPNIAVSIHASANTWHRVKREQAFRNGVQHYNKLTIHGPADYFILTSTNILQTTSKAADRLQRERLLRAYGLERFLGCIRKKTFESGAILAREDEQLPWLYFVLEGECRASVHVDDHVDVDPLAEETIANAAAGRSDRTKFPHKPTQLPIASLGPRSLVGDVSMLLGLREPATIQAVTAVSVLALAEEDFIKEGGDMRDPAVAAPMEGMKKVAVETMGFVLERIKAEATYNKCHQAKRIQALESSFIEKKLDLETPHARRIRKMSSITRAAPYYSIASQAPRGGRGSMAEIYSTPSPVPRRGSGKSKIPRVVQEYLESVAPKSPHSAAGGGLAPVILSKRSHKTTYELVECAGGPSRLTREQRKAVLALNSIHSPLAARSLGPTLLLRGSASDLNRDADGDESELTSPSNPIHSPHDDRFRQQVDETQLFLFPTMTRQRQLHARSLPLLPKYRGVDVNNQL